MLSKLETQVELYSHVSFKGQYAFNYLELVEQLLVLRLAAVSDFVHNSKFCDIPQLAQVWLCFFLFCHVGNSNSCTVTHTPISLLAELQLGDVWLHLSYLFIHLFFDVQAVIRVRFPDNYTLEAKFHPSDTVQSLMDLLMKVIARPDLPFYICK